MLCCFATSLSPAAWKGRAGRSGLKGLWRTGVETGGGFC